LGSFVREKVGVEVRGRQFGGQTSYGYGKKPNIETFE
jgi:hypothetical protein